MSPVDEKAARRRELARRFLQSLGQAIKLVSLYKNGHPVSVSAVEQSWQLLHDLFAETGGTEHAFGLVAGRWTADDEVIADSAQAFELLAMAMRAHAIRSLTFLAAVRPFELGQLCEMGATPANRMYETDAGEFLLERGVKHIRANVEEYVRRRRVKPPASALIQNPLAGLHARRPAASSPPAAPAAPAAPAPARPAAAAERGFGGFIKSLIDGVIADPAERSKVYTEAVQLVEQALARHVSQATHKLLLEKQGILNERMRAEHVLSAVAEGKVTVDKEGRVLMMDPAAEEVVGRQFVDMAGKPILDSMGAGEQVLALAQDLIVPENGPVSDQVRVSGETEVLDAFRKSLALVQDEQGRLVGTYAVLPYAAKYREALKMQEQFVAGVTHDLKAPLASICSTLELISDKARGKLSAEEAEFLDISLRNSRALSQMISEILDFSKLESGQLSIKAEAIPVAAALRECRDALTPWARSKGVTLALDESAAALSPVLADHARVVQILNNLVSNAIKCTPAGGTITLSASPGTGEAAGALVVSVRDTGCGISAPDQKRLFSRFTQLVTPGARREGVGLGLAIVKELVTRHKGRVWVESELGKGSVFRFTLPLAGPSGG